VLIVSFINSLVTFLKLAIEYVLKYYNSISVII
jgi:hypothetical protein